MPRRRSRAAGPCLTACDVRDTFNRGRYPQGDSCYYYAHLERCFQGLHEGMPERPGEAIGYVGTSGNAPPNTPHLCFAIFRLGPEKHWWQGTYRILIKLVKAS